MPISPIPSAYFFFLLLKTFKHLFSFLETNSLVNSLSLHIVMHSTKKLFYFNLFVDLSNFSVCQLSELNLAANLHHTFQLKAFSSKYERKGQMCGFHTGHSNALVISWQFLRIFSQKTSRSCAIEINQSLIRQNAATDEVKASHFLPISDLRALFLFVCLNS